MKYLLVLSLLYITDVVSPQNYGGPASDPILDQAPPSITSTGKSPTLKCTMRGSKVSNHVLSWYRQTYGNGIQFLVSHRDRNRPIYGEGIAERFIPELEVSTNSFTMTIGNTEKGDEGLYYCAVWYSNKYIFGQGTEVKVEATQDIRRPSAILFQPSLVEIQYKRTATFLCHAKGYFPRPLRIKWLLNKEPHPESVLFPAMQNKDQSYDQTSSATIQSNQWKKGAEMACVVDHESGEQTMSIVSSQQDSIIFSKDCKPAMSLPGGFTAAPEGTTNDTQEITLKKTPGYPEILSSAFIAYAALLGSSVLYGAALSCCLIRRKMVQSKEKKKETSFSK